jgi:hypothetical protein
MPDLSWESSLEAEIDVLRFLANDRSVRLLFGPAWLDVTARFELEKATSLCRQYATRNYVALVVDCYQAVSPPLVVVMSWLLSLSPYNGLREQAMIQLRQLKPSTIWLGFSVRGAWRSWLGQQYGSTVWPFHVAPPAV